MEKYYIGFYTTNGKDKIRGTWKTSEAEVREEAESTLFKIKLGQTLTGVGSIDKVEVEKIAKEHNLSIEETLDCL